MERYGKVVLSFIMIFIIYHSFTTSVSCHLHLHPSGLGDVMYILKVRGDSFTSELLTSKVHWSRPKLGLSGCRIRCSCSYCKHDIPVVRGASWLEATLRKLVRSSFSKVLVFELFDGSSLFNNSVITLTSHKLT